MLFDAVSDHFLALSMHLSRLRLSALTANRLACNAYEKVGFRPYEITYERPLKRRGGHS